MEQGRLAACHAFQVEQSTLPTVLPYGIYTIPEISTVGKTEEELTKEGVPYEIGRAFYKEIARGQIVGDLEGDRKSTRLNSSHLVISYAVFCLKKKKNKYKGLSACLGTDA